MTDTNNEEKLTLDDKALCEKIRKEWQALEKERQAWVDAYIANALKIYRMELKASKKSAHLTNSEDK